MNQPPCFPSSTARTKIPYPRTESIASYAHLMARERQGPSIHSPSQTALLTECQGYAMAKDNPQGKNVPHMQQVCISDRKAKTHTDIYI